jgi:cysteine protease ATG4
LILDEKLLQEDILSRFWFTYRKGFSNIGGDGPDTDQGWGCMLRCGQMLLAECFLRIYLERNFKWDQLNNGNPFYWKILSSFRDDKQAPYSVQQIGKQMAFTF